MNLVVFLVRAMSGLESQDKPSMNLVDFRGLLPVYYCFNLAKVHYNSILGYHMIKELEFFYPKPTPTKLCKKKNDAHLAFQAPT